MKSKYEKIPQKVEVKPLKVKDLPRNAHNGFHLLSSINRPVKQEHVNDLVESIKVMGIIRPVVIAVISFLTGRPLRYIIDGQHLFHACLALDIEIPWCEIEIKDHTEMVEKIALLNSSSKSWCMDDYIVAWASISPHYKTLNYHLNAYPKIDRATIAAILSGGTTGNSMGFTLKSGKFVVFNEQENKKVLEELAEIDKCLGKIASLQRRSIHRDYVSYRRNIANYDHKNFLRVIKANYDKILEAAGKGEHVTEIFRKIARK